MALGLRKTFLFILLIFFCFIKALMILVVKGVPNDIFKLGGERVKGNTEIIFASIYNKILKGHSFPIVLL